MNTKILIKIALLLFVAGSIAWLVVDEFRSKDHADLLTETKVEAPPAASQANPSAAEQPAQKVILYYFHGTMRCPTCKKFESFTNEVLQNDFLDAMKSETLEWRVVNVDLPENKHFVNDYQLYSKSIVIVKMRDGKQFEWKNLEKIWKLVGDKSIFMNYIKDEVNSYLETN